MPNISTIFFRLAGVRLTFSIQLPPVSRLPEAPAGALNIYLILYLVSPCFATLSPFKKISFFCQIVLAIHCVICYYINCLRCKRPYVTTARRCNGWLSANFATRA